MVTQLGTMHSAAIKFFSLTYHKCLGWDSLLDILTCFWQCKNLMRFWGLGICYVNNSYYEILQFGVYMAQDIDVHVIWTNVWIGLLSFQFSFWQLVTLACWQCVVYIRFRFYATRAFEKCSWEGTNTWTMNYAENVLQILLQIS